ncbi:PREDICTED: protein SFI1 homolog [Elephantulus edwardii]|uniref:protein SFI1 homolog n=1 Tax=Elephantulus edwardii TaxID=28737 RepID=UPI0003F0D9DD|nr:PREDICTED: protein SFI1 homolog [Elephantulus edwardii]
MRTPYLGGGEGGGPYPPETVERGRPETWRKLTHMAGEQQGPRLAERRGHELDCGCADSRPWAGASWAGLPARTGVCGVASPRRQKRSGKLDGAVKKPHSLRTPSSKKSSALSVVQNQLPSTRHPVQRRALHTWNRKGRLRELRLRCVARKFLYLWIRKTFGRIFPSKARFHYEQKVLQKVFKEWKEEWWISHREWKLCIRADCHYRYYLYNQMFQTWKTYVLQQREMRTKYTRAEDYDAKQKMRRAWKRWLIYVVVRRTKLEMQTAAMEFRHRSILLIWWREWRRCLEQVHMAGARHASAVKHRDRTLQQQAWSRWQEQLLHIQRDRQKMACALKHLQHRQKRSCLRAWLEYLQLRRAKRQRAETAERFHRVNMLQTRFCDWQWAWKWRESLYAHHALVEELATRMALRRAFTHWKHYVLICVEEAAQYKMAEEHHRRHLLTFCFRALQGNVAQARLQQIRRNLAHRQHEAALLRRFWDSWLCRVEQREEREQLSSLLAAWAHYRTTLLHKCIRRWSQHTQKRHYKQMLQARADGHFQRTALPAAFLAWKSRWRWQQRDRALNTRATCFHRETLERQVFGIWWQKTFQHQENRLAERVAILHAERQLLCRAWSTWHQQAAAHHQERQRQALACVHHRHWQLRRACRVWRESTHGLRAEKLGQVRAVEFHSLQLLRWAWNRWKESMALLHAQRRKLVLADLHHQRSLLHRVLRRWLTYQDGVRRVLQEVAARESRHNRHLLRGALRHWRKNTVARADEAQKTLQARDHYRRTICSKVFVYWREEASVQIYYRQQEDSAVSKARAMLDRGYVLTVFRRWRSRSQSSAQQRVQLERAAKHHTRRLLREALSRWKSYHRGWIRKTLLQRRGAQLLAQRLCRTCFHQWRRQLAARREEQQGTARALWFWSFSLQAKAWDAWQGFVQERRRKRARLEQAMQTHQQQLLQRGVTHLLRFTAATKASRQQLLVQQQAQMAHSLYRIVHRCAMLWKQKALGPAREPQSIVPGRRVTFEVPLLSCIPDRAGDTSLETRTQGTRPRRGLDSLALAAGDRQLPELGVAHPERKQPRRPDFLLEFKQSQKPLEPKEHGLTMVPPANRSQTALAPQGPPSKPEAPASSSWTALAPQGPPSEPRALLRPPEPRLPPTESAPPELVLLPPSSFMLHEADQSARVSAKLQAPPALASASSLHLLLPGDLTGPGFGPGPEVAGVHPGALGSTDLELELEGIRQQLQHYQITKQNLGSCQRQARSLRRWLELSREEPEPEDREAEQQVQSELEEVEAQIQHLAAELRAQRQPVGACIARVQALWRALC